MCAATAGQRGLRVLLIDHAEKLAEKIRISGGGKCNFTNLKVGAEHYLSRNPHFTRSALSRYTSRNFIDLVERHGIAYHERSWGQLFCDDSALQIIRMLQNECDEGRVQWSMGTAIHRIEAVSEAREQFGQERFVIETSRGTWAGRNLVIATGGLAVPKIGATPFGYKVAQQFGLPVVAPKPALVPLMLSPETLERLNPLAGISFDAQLTCRKGQFSEAVLLTHRGLSGPAVLQVSSYWQAQAYEDKDWAPVSINLLPGLDVEAWLLSHGSERTLLGNVLSEKLPRRFAHAWCELQGWSLPINQYSPARLREVAAILTDWRLVPSGTQGYAKAEVTLGGVDTQALSSKTMEARTCPGLYFIGEVMDVTGHLGGYNFQWAWSSAYAAGQSIL